MHAHSQTILGMYTFLIYLLKSLPGSISLHVLLLRIKQNPHFHTTHLHTKSVSLQVQGIHTFKPLHPVLGISWPTHNPVIILQAR